MSIELLRGHVYHAVERQGEKRLRPDHDIRGASRRDVAWLPLDTRSSSVRKFWTYSVAEAGDRAIARIDPLKECWSRIGFVVPGY